MINYDEKQSGMILLSTLAILLILSLIVYSSIYTGNVTEKSMSDVGKGALVADINAENIVEAIEQELSKYNANNRDDIVKWLCDRANYTTNVIHNGQSVGFTFNFPRNICTGNDCLPIGEIQGLKTPEGLLENRFITVVENQLFFRIVNLGRSDAVSVNKNAPYIILRITGVALNGDATSAIETLYAIADPNINIATGDYLNDSEMRECK